MQCVYCETIAVSYTYILITKNDRCLSVSFIFSLILSRNYPDSLSHTQLVFVNHVNHAKEARLQGLISLHKALGEFVICNYQLTMNLCFCELEVRITE